MKNLLCKYRQKLNFINDKELFHYASSLSFHTVLSLFPILMISLSIFMQLPTFKNYYEKIRNFIFSNLVPTHQETLNSYIDSFLQNSIELGITGFIGVILTSVLFFNDFEYIISKISHTKPKGFFRSLSTYWTLITLAPLGLATSFYIGNFLQNLLDKSGITSWINLIAIFPYIVIWAIFAVSYASSINQEIRAKSIIFSSFVASSCWWISKFLFVQYAFYNKTYTSIYGSFSVIFFFLLWIYISWIFFLYGVKLSVFFEDKFQNPAVDKTKISQTL